MTEIYATGNGLSMDKPIKEKDPLEDSGLDTDKITVLLLLGDLVLFIYNKDYGFYGLIAILIYKYLGIR